ncbi:MAG: hypothetical protein QW241_08580 [Candidatus Bathyarchaeia archaeon]
MDMGRTRAVLRRQVPLWLLILLVLLVGAGAAAAITVYTLIYYAKAATAIVSDDTLIRIDGFPEYGKLYIAETSESANTEGELSYPYSRVNNDITAGHYIISFTIRENLEVYAGRSWKVYVYFGGTKLGEFTITQNTVESGATEGVEVHVDLGLGLGQEGQLPDSSNPVRIIAIRQS